MYNSTSEYVCVCVCVYCCCCCSVAVMSGSLQPHVLQPKRLHCPSPSPCEVCSNSCPLESVMPSNCFILCLPLLLLPSIFPIIRVFSSEFAVCIRWPEFWNFSISPSNEYSGWFPLELTGLISLQSKDSQESSPAPKLKSINSSALSLLYGQTLTFVHDYWKNHSFDYTEVYQQSVVSAF